MNKSTTTTIKGYIYTIQSVDPDYSELRSNDSNLINLGKTDCLKQIIYIRNDLQPTRMFEVIIHELTHAFLDVYGFGQVSFDEEHVCSFNECYASDIISIAHQVLKALI